MSESTAGTGSAVSPNRLSLQHFLLLVLLFTSGLCGISYEILYGRLLANIIGDQFIVSAGVLLTFLLGIGLGALHAHRLWRGLWLIEAGIGIYAVCFAYNLPGIESFLYAHLPGIGTDPALSIVAAVALLLVPAFLIGVSLPLFAGYAHRLRAEGYFSQSYGVYNVGAALTVIFIEFWLIREVGIRYAVYFMGACNLLVAVVLLVFYRHLASGATYSFKVDGSGFSRRVLAALVLCSIGSAIFQLTAVRFSEFLLGPFRETFAYVLCIILLGIALGSFLVHRYRVGFVPLLIANIVTLAWALCGLMWVMRLFAIGYPVVAESYWLLVALKFACIALIALGPATTFGATIPALFNTLDSQAVTRSGGDRSSARSPGYLLYVASLANAAGFLLMCLVLHQRLDYGDLLLVIALLSGAGLVVIGAFGSGSEPHDSHRRGLSWGVLVALAVLVSGSRLLWSEQLLYQGHTSFHSTQVMQLRLEDHVVSERYKGEQDVLSINRRDGIPYFFINGRISIRLDKAAEKVVGAIGAIFAPDHQKAMVLGVGSGATAGSVGLMFKEVEAVEISGVILDNLGRLEEYNFGLADMPNVRLVHDDALHAVKVAQQNYSLILNTVTSPLFFSSSKLYTVEFLQEVQRHLAPGGLYMTWLDSRVGEKGADIMMETVTRVFEHCGLAQLGSAYLLMLCSDSPIMAHHPSVVARQPQLARYFREEHTIDPGAIAYQLLHTDAAALRNPSGAPLNTLDKPVLEFEMARVVRQSIVQLQQRILQGINLEKLGSAFRNFDWGLAPMVESMGQVSGKTVYYDAFLLEYEAFQQKYADGIAAERAGDCKRAGALFRQSLGVYGERASLRLREGRCYENHGMYASALAAYSTERELHAGNTQLSLVIGRVLLSLELYEAAQTELQRVPIVDQSGAYHYLLGLALRELGDEAEAHRHLAVAEEIHGSSQAAASAAMQVTGEAANTR